VEEGGLSRINLRTLISVLESRKPCLHYTRQNIYENLLLQMRQKLLAHNWMVHFLSWGVKVYNRKIKKIINSKQWRQARDGIISIVFMSEEDA
jgi:hypothetical protein